MAFQWHHTGGTGAVEPGGEERSEGKTQECHLRYGGDVPLCAPNDPKVVANDLETFVARARRGAEVAEVCTAENENESEYGKQRG